MRRLWMILVLFLLSGCGQPKWYHPNKGPGDFARDRALCEQESILGAKAQSLTGKVPPALEQAKFFSLCMMKKGWSNTPPTSGAGAGAAPAAQEVKASALAERPESNTFVFAGQKIVLPEGAKIVRDFKTVNSQVQIEAVFFEIERDGRTLLGELYFHQAPENLQFEEAQYPIGPPFFSYDEGRLLNGSPWRAFAGLTQNGWSGGLGSFCKVNDQQRFVLAFSGPLPAQTKPPPPECRLDVDQGRSLDQMIAAVMPWMNSLGEPVEESSWKILKQGRIKLTF